MTGMELIRAKRGMISKIAADIGLTRGAVAMWQTVPAERILAIERITGIPRHELRPDLWEAPADAKADAPADAA